MLLGDPEDDCAAFSCLGATSKLAIVATELTSGGAPITDRTVYLDRFDAVDQGEAALAQVRRKLFIDTQQE